MSPGYSHHGINRAPLINFFNQLGPRLVKKLARTATTVFSAGLLFWLMVGSASAQSFSAVVKYDTGDNPQGGAVGDFNGDGYDDFAVANS